MLHGSSCEGPCCGGSACAVTGENSVKEGCRVGSSTCDTCMSGVTCVPGECTRLFDGDESWSLTLSAIAERGPDRSVVDPCKAERDTWLCIRSKSHPESVCVSQVDSCQHGAKGTMTVPIASSDLITDGFDLEVRVGGPTGAVLASKVEAKYPGGIKRRTLCGGLRMNFADTEPVAYVTYFLDLPERTLVSDEMARLEASVKASQEREADLMAALNNARDDADRARIQAELQKTQEQAAAARRGLSGAGSGSSGGASKPVRAACNCTPGDPLCSCL